MAPLKLLLAEDDPAMREILCETLEGEGFFVLAAADGQQAVEFHGAQGPFDVLLLDEDMPKLRGRQALALLRDAGVSTPALFLTSALISEDECRRLGIRALLRKPVPTRELVAALRKACVDAAR